jgi:hypothetical protein
MGEQICLHLVGVILEEIVDSTGKLNTTDPGYFVYSFAAQKYGWSTIKGKDSHNKEAIGNGCG